MDARRSPSWILGHHAKDQFANFLRSLSSPNRPAHFGNQLPIQPEASPMPLDHRFRVDHDKRLFPPGPEPPRHDPEQLIEYRKPGPCVPPFQCRELLAKSKVFKKQHASGEKHAKDRAKQESEGVCHATLLRHFACEMQCCILLKSKADRILANDRVVCLAYCSATTRFRLPNDFQRKLNIPRLRCKIVDGSRGARRSISVKDRTAIDWLGWHKVRVIQDVEKLRTKLDVEDF